MNGNKANTNHYLRLLQRPAEQTWGQANICDLCCNLCENWDMRKLIIYLIKYNEKQLNNN